MSCFALLYKELAGEFNIKASDQELWKKAKNKPEEIAREICSFKGNYTDPETGDMIFITEDDVVVQHCSWHYGRKENNPLSSVRFVNREELLGKSHDFLNAYEVNEDDYETILPRSFMKQCIRVYSRDSSKTELVHHKFQAWKQSIKEGGKGFPETPPEGNFEILDDGSSAQFSHHEGSCAVLSQDSVLSHDDNSNLTTPKKSLSRATAEEPSPIPIPSFRTYR